jgi:hypothetical protein
MFVAEADKWGWQQEDLGLFDRLMKKHPTSLLIEPKLTLERLERSRSNHANMNRSIISIDSYEN